MLHQYGYFVPHMPMPYCTFDWAIPLKQSAPECQAKTKQSNNVGDYASLKATRDKAW
jgi:hypothetical protein